jgi:hypothetical protein
MIPCQQVAELSRDTAARFKSFEMGVLTAAKTTPEEPKPLRCFVRDKDGRVLRELTNEKLEIPVDEQWSDGFLSTNFGEGGASYYFLLKPRFSGEAVTASQLRSLLKDYEDFARRRLDYVIARYGARGARTGDLFWRIMPTEIVCMTPSAEIARAMAERCGATQQGNAVRISAVTLDTLKERQGADWVVANKSDLTCVAPWTSFLGLPRVKDGAALYQIGWVEYRSDPTAKPRREAIAVAMW